MLSAVFNPNDVYNMAEPDELDLDQMKYFKNLRDHCQRQQLAPVANWVYQTMSTHYDEATERWTVLKVIMNLRANFGGLLRARRLAKGFTAAFGCRKVDKVSPMTSGSSSHHSSGGRRQHGQGSSAHM